MNSIGAKSGEVATVSLPAVTTFRLAVVASGFVPVGALAELLPQPARTEASIKAARAKLTIFFIFIFSFAVGLIDGCIIARILYKCN